MKHFVKKHKHHFGLWFLSAIVFVSSLFWLDKIKQQEVAPTSLPEEKIAVESIIPQESASATAPTKKELPAAVFSKALALPISTTTAVAAVAILSEAVPEVEKINVTFKISVLEKTRELTVEVPVKSTVYDAMLLLNQERKLAVEFKSFAGMGAMVQAIDGMANDTRANKFWIYYINGQAAQLGISYYIIKPNDLIEWKYEASWF